MQCAFAVAEVQKVTQNLSLTCGFEVAEHLLLFCEICGCGAGCKFAVAELGVNLRCPAMVVSDSALQIVLLNQKHVSNSYSYKKS